MLTETISFELYFNFVFEFKRSIILHGLGWKYVVADCSYKVVFFVKTLSGGCLAVSF